jgi:cystathionine beta-lyase family protein involved in aluminum resistance
MYQGFFNAPHVTAQALKTAVFAAALFDELGFNATPRHDEQRHDIIQIIELGSAERVTAFCKGVQQGAPVDSYVTPEPWDMPGYTCPVIMAAGSFIQGASIELSADAPMREPYNVYLQGGITYESGKIGILKAAETLLACGS